MIPAKATAGRRVVIIGDVHGCLEDLHLLLENVAEPNDLIICTGDITGKGPDVLDVSAVLRGPSPLAESG